ncbi:MAG: DUF47 family protein [Candidatus Nezhaarchaeales archaeon]
MGRERERRVLERAKEHMAHVLEVVRALREEVRAFCRGDGRGVEEWFRRVFEAERRADELKRGIINNMASQLFHPIDRDEITRLVLAIDDIASNAKGAGSRMMLMEPRVEDGGVVDGLLELADGLVAISEETLNTVGLLVESPKEALREADRVERLEEEIDDVRRRLLGRILRMGDSLGPSRLICLKEVVDSMENVADCCEDVADVVRSLAVLSA